MNKFAVLPDGRCVVADYRQNRLIELEHDGKTIRTLNVRGAWCVEALRNGNYLVSTLRPFRVIEVDPAGRTVWEVATNQRTGRVRAVLDKVHIGFDKPRPADFDLDSAATRVRGLRAADATVRRCSAEFLTYLKPKDDASVAALVVALDDEDVTVRSQVADALAQIGAPALPRLIQTLKTGTASSRVAASDALGRMGPEAKSALPELIELVRDGKNNSALRCQATMTIGHIGPEGDAAVLVLLNALKGADDTLRSRSALALIAIAPNNEAVLAALVAALKDKKYPGGQQAAVKAITGIRFRR